LATASGSGDLPPGPLPTGALPLSDPARHTSDAAPPSEARLYALTHTGTPGDADWYVARCARASSVLELGCGAGRVTRPLAAPGRCTVGMDLDPGLLRLARRGRGAGGVHWVRGDMRRFAFATSFERILVPHSGLYALLSEADCERCLRRVAHHLAPGGRFCFDVYAADAFHFEADPKDVERDELEYVTTLEHADRRYDVFERCRWHRAEQRLDVVYEYVPRAGGASLQARVPQRYWLWQQIEPLLARAGLVPCAVSGDFAGGPVRPEDDALYVVEARRA